MFAFKSSATEFGMLEAAEAHAAEALLGDISRGGDCKPSTVIIATIVRGIARAGGGDHTTADLAFETAVCAAEAGGRRMYGIFALHAWKQAAATRLAVHERVAARWAVAVAKMASAECVWADLATDFWHSKGAQS